jgi:hypothetical protein
MTGELEIKHRYMTGELEIKHRYMTGRGNFAMVSGKQV